MKIHAKLVASVFLFSIFRDVVSSNPDSEVVQESAKPTQRRSTEIRSADGRPGIALVNDRYSGIKILRRYYTNIGEVWKEVGTNDDTIRIRDFGGVLDISRTSNYNRTEPDRYFVYRDHSGGSSGRVPSNVGLTNAYGSNIGALQPNGNVPYNRGSSGYISTSYKPDGRITGGSSNVGQPNGYGTNGRAPEPNGNVPFGSRVPDGYISTNYKPDVRMTGGSSSGGQPNGYGTNGRAPEPNGNVPFNRVPDGYISTNHKPDVSITGSGYSVGQPNGYGTNGRAPEPNGKVPNGYVPNGYEPNGRGPGGNRYPDIVATTHLPERSRAPPPPNVPDYNGGRSPDETTSHRKVSPDSNLFAGIVNDFAFNLVENLRPQTNFVISPLSIFTTLAIGYLGSGGKTKRNLEKALGLDDYSVHNLHLHQGISDLLSMFTQESEAYRLYQASLLLLANNITIEEPFKEDVKRYYGAEVKKIDFNNQQASLRDINAWVAKSTKNMIPNIFARPMPPFTRLLLLNAMFFKGTWKTAFPLESTSSNEFYSLDGSSNEVPFMNHYRKTFSFHKDSKLRHSFLKLPYQGDEVSMVIALPDTLDGDPMPSVTDKELCHVQDAMKNVPMSSVAVPKFRLESLQSLKEPLTQMGIGDLFNKSINFTRVRRQNDLYLTDIVQKAVVDFDEKGTTAAAVTTMQLHPLDDSVDQFVANHPFAFYIVHEPSGLVLFYGKVYDLGERSSVGRNGGGGSKGRHTDELRRNNNPELPQRKEQPQYMRY